MTHPVKITDHKARGLGLILSQFAKSPRLLELSGILLDQVQDFEDLAFDYLSERLLPSAQGVFLERLGKSIGEKRGKFTDDAEYRRIILARALANASEGGIQVMIDIVDQIMGPFLTGSLPDVRHIQSGRKHFRIEYDVSTPPGQEFRDALDRMICDLAKAGADSCRIIEADAGSFRLDIGPGLDVGELASVVGES